MHQGNLFTTLTSLALAIISQTVKQQYRCYLEEDGASGRMTHSARRRLHDVILPGAGDNFADRETTVLLLFRRRWCIREDSNLRPLGS